MYPKPWRITLDTNPDDCNLHCVMCEEHSLYNTKKLQAGKAQQHRRMSLALLEKTLAQAIELGVQEVIPSTMGEPLLYKHFNRITDICSEHNLRLNLTTNGTFPRKSVREWAEQLVPILSDIKISWNGATKETAESIMVGINWEKTNRNVQEFIAYRNRYFKEQGHYARVTFQLTFMNNNVEELAQIVELAIALGVDRVKGHHLWTHFDRLKSLSVKNNRESVLRWNEAVEQVRAIARHQPLPNGKTILLENIEPIEADSQDYQVTQGECPFLGKEIWCNTEGRFDPCCAPNDQRKALGNFGTIQETSLKAIWEGEQYQRLVTSYQDHALCSTCNMKRVLTEQSILQGERNECT